MKLQPLMLVPLLMVAACQGAPSAPAASPSAATGATPSAAPAVAAGACAAPALVVDAAGKASAVGSAGAGAGTCVPIQEAGTKAIEARAASGKYRLTLESPKGMPDSADPKGSLVLRLYDGAGKEINDATLTLVLVHAQMGQGHGFDPNGLPAKTRAEGGYLIDPVAWPMAGSWLVTAKVKAGGTDDQVFLAFNVI